MIHSYQGVTILGIIDTARKVKLDLKTKAPIWLFYGALIGFTIWFVSGLILDYFSHIGIRNTMLFP